MQAVQKLGRLFPLRYRTVTPLEEDELGSVVDVPEGFVPTNPSIAEFGGRRIANVRCVNYRLHGERTLKSSFLTGDDWQSVNRVISWEGPHPDRPSAHPELSRLLGDIEDVRFLAIGDRLHASGTCYENGVGGIALFTFDTALELVGRQRFSSPFGFGQEKNWAPFEKDGELFYIYALNPLIVLRRDTSEAGYRIVNGDGTRPSDISFNTGGSSQGIPFADGWLFVFHRRRVQPFVSGTIYVHYFVWISRDFRTVRRGEPFVIDRPAVHFVSGMIRDGEDLLLSYGRADSAALLALLPLSDLPIPVA